MSRKEIRVDELAEPISHFTDARAGRRLPLRLRRSSRWTAGGGSSEATTSSHRRGRSSRTCSAVLEAGGCGFEDVVKVTVFLTDIDDRALINPVRQEFFGETRPASTLVEVPRLAVPGAKVEIECVALVP